MTMRKIQVNMSRPSLEKARKLVGPFGPAIEILAVGIKTDAGFLEVRDEKIPEPVGFGYLHSVLLECQTGREWHIVLNIFVRNRQRRMMNKIERVTVPIFFQYIRPEEYWHCDSFYFVHH